METGGQLYWFIWILKAKYFQPSSKSSETLKNVLFVCMSFADCSHLYFEIKLVPTV